MAGICHSSEARVEVRLPDVYDRNLCDSWLGLLLKPSRDFGAGLQEGLACRKVVFPCGLALPPQRNIPEQGKMIDINLFLLLADPNLPKEWLGLKWSCHSFPFLGHLSQSLAEGHLLVLKAPDVEMFQAVGVPG